MLVVSSLRQICREAHGTPHPRGILFIDGVCKHPSPACVSNYACCPTLQLSMYLPRSLQHSFVIHLTLLVMSFASFGAAFS